MKARIVARSINVASQGVGLSDDVARAASSKWRFRLLPCEARAVKS